MDTTTSNHEVLKVSCYLTSFFPLLHSWRLRNDHQSHDTVSVARSPQSGRCRRHSDPRARLHSLSLFASPGKTQEGIEKYLGSGPSGGQKRALPPGWREKPEKALPCAVSVAFSRPEMRITSRSIPRDASPWATRRCSRPRLPRDGFAPTRRRAYH